ncbi:sodium-dependent nutrient amino acid transporter 1-like [Tachypleus tridentatus]|uniref:sodium-dependent nutrient amino acid transporter 1-like n=1 Tax=Tachypleus tridentatus TaxID=6853 RepID=UPI003FD29B4A
MPWKRRKQNFMLKSNEDEIQTVSLKPLSPVEEEFHLCVCPQPPVTSRPFSDALYDKESGPISNFTVTKEETGLAFNQTPSVEESGARPVQTLSKEGPGSISNQPLTEEERERFTFVTTNGLQVIRLKRLKSTSQANGHNGSTLSTTVGVSLSSRNGSSMRDDNLVTADFRGTWSRGLEFFLSTLTMSVGLINLLRFPDLLHKNGGAAFLVPYFTFLFLVGIPVYYMELALGQFSRFGPAKVWKVVPLLKGIGFSQLVSSIYLTLYTSYFMSTSLFYLIASIWSPLPWTSKITNSNNSFPCDLVEDLQKANTSVTSYWNYFLLQFTVQEPSSVNYRFVLCLLLSWLITFFTIFKRVRSIGKVAYITTFYPCVCLLVMMISTLTKDGARSGIVYFFAPKWEKLQEKQVWCHAGLQSLLSLGVGFGQLNTYASYNRFRHNIQRDTIIITLVDAGISILFSLLLSSYIGNIASRENENVTYEYVKTVMLTEDYDTAPEMTLGFLVFPRLLSSFGSLPRLWCILFFIMIYMLGLGSTMAYIENIISIIRDQCTALQKRSIGLPLCTCAVGCLLSLPLCTDGWKEILMVISNYGMEVAVVLIIFLEIVGVMWFYGFLLFSDDVSFMLKSSVNMYWKITWTFIAPPALIVVLVLHHMDNSDLTSDTWTVWSTAVYWILSGLVLIQIPVWAVIKVVRSDEYGLKRRLQYQLKPALEWGPELSERLNWLNYRDARRPAVHLQASGNYNLAFSSDM